MLPILTTHEFGIIPVSNPRQEFNAHTFFVAVFSPLEIPPFSIGLEKLISLGVSEYYHDDRLYIIYYISYIILYYIYYIYYILYYIYYMLYIKKYILYIIYIYYILYIKYYILYYTLYIIYYISYIIYYIVYMSKLGYKWVQ